MRNLCIFIFIIFVLFIFHYRNITEGLDETVYTKCMVQRVCNECDPTTNTRKCSYKWVAPPGTIEHSQCSIDVSGSSTPKLVPTFSPATGFPLSVSCENIISYHSQDMYNGSSSVDSTDNTLSKKTGKMDPDIIVSFIENVSTELNDILTSKEIYEKVKKMSEKYMSNNQSNDELLDPKDIQKGYITRYDKPDMKSFNNRNPIGRTKFLMDHQILIDENNIDKMPISYDYMKKQKGPSWYDSLWTYID